MTDQTIPAPLYIKVRDLPPPILFFCSFVFMFWAAIAGYIAHSTASGWVARMVWMVCLGLTALALDLIDHGVTRFLREPAPLVRIRALDLVSGRSFEAS